MNNFNEMLTGILSEKANKDGLFGVKINDKGTTIFFKDGSEQKREAKNNYYKSYSHRTGCRKKHS